MWSRSRLRLLTLFSFTLTTATFRIVLWLFDDRVIILVHGVHLHHCFFGFVFLFFVFFIKASWPRYLLTGIALAMIFDETPVWLLGDMNHAIPHTYIPSIAVAFLIFFSAFLPEPKRDSR